MKFYFILALTVGLLIQSSLRVNAQGTASKRVYNDNVKHKINNLDQVIERAYLNKDVEEILKMYTTDAAFV
jgi:hypothetical protein